MKKLSKDQKAKIKASLSLLCEDNTSIDKFQKISELIKGINPNLDKKLKTASEILDKIKKVYEGDVITLSAENLSEKTKKQKKYKKYLLLFITNLKDLKGEITRISDLQNAIAGAGGAGEIGKTEAVKAGKIALTAKGPAGAITLTAVGIVAVTAFISSKIVTISVKNENCQPIEPVTEQTINIPGLKLPSQAIVTGSQDKVVMPGLNFTLDWTNGNNISLTALNFTRSYDLGSDLNDIVLDGQSLAGKKSEIKLSKSKTHDVVVRCKLK